MRHLAEGIKARDKEQIHDESTSRAEESDCYCKPAPTDQPETALSEETCPETGPNEGEEAAVILSPMDQAFVSRATEAIFLALEKDQTIEVDSLAKTLGMGPSQLYRKMTAVTGHSPINYIQYIKVKKACQLLIEHPSMCLAEIAERSGFNDYSNFLRTFKSHCGVPPSRYVRERAPLTPRRCEPS